MSGVVLAAAYTLRSRAYAQALAQAGLAPDRVILYGDPGLDVPRDIPSPVDAVDSIPDLFLPDFSETLTTTCEKNGWTHESSQAPSINSAA